MNRDRNLPTIFKAGFSLALRSRAAYYMIRRSTGFKSLLIVIFTDALAVSISLAFTYWLRFYSGIVPLLPGREGFLPGDYLRLFPAFTIVWIFCLYLLNAYKQRQLLCGMGAFVRIVKGSILALALIIAADFFVRDSRYGYSRTLFVLIFFSGICWLYFFRLILRRILSSASIPHATERVRLALLGTGPLARYVTDRIKKNPWYGYDLIGIIDTPDRCGEDDDNSASHLGVMSEISSIIRENDIHEIFVTRSDLEPDVIFNLILECEKDMVEVRIVLNLLEMMVTEVSLDELDGIPLCSLKETPLQGINALIKRIFDIFASGFGLLLLSVPFAIIAFLIKRESPGSAFYRQERIGADGKTFQMFKFRSMRPDAEADSGPVWSSNEDPRVTRLGRHLRRFNIDELPQLINVFLGDMSLVGPRPERPYFVDKFKHQIPRYMTRHRVKSGITGWAQVHGLRGAHTPLTERVRYDLYYIENWTFWLDLKILVMTFFSQRRIV